MFLKFSVINVSSNDHALVVHFHLCSANGNRTSDGHYLHLNQIAKQMNRIGKMFFVHLLKCCGECYRLFAQGRFLPMPLCGVSPKLPYCIVITSIFLKIRNSRESHQDIKACSKRQTASIVLSPAWNHNVLQSFG